MNHKQNNMVEVLKNSPAILEEDDVEILFKKLPLGRGNGSSRSMASFPPWQK